MWTAFAVIFWTVVAGLIGVVFDNYSGSSSFGIICAIAVAAAFITSAIERNVKKSEMKKVG